ncbi:MAG: 16S rRNA (guanine(966)-N(2))-methyltransferase RsmD [Caldimicrobium sp.]|nr:16S rRNA (guanine(966)-N(2))-methyltransferase RsmD [Caldimicrobium sp.]
MRITGGYLKGRSFYTPKRGLFDIRPLRSRIRKALFDILGNDLNGIKVLDLFAGTGALGLEALSRGAELVVFVDSSLQSRELIKKNLLHLNLHFKALIKNWKLPQDFEKLKKFAQERAILFDLVFITPPYETNLALKSLEYFPVNVLTRRANIIVEERTSVDLPNTINFLHLEDKRNYGETTLYFYIFKDNKEGRSLVQE